MKCDEEILNALEKGNNDTLLKDIAPNFSIGDLKQMLLSAIVKGRMVANDGEIMKDWQKYDNENWEFPDLIKNFTKYSND
jgi:hypothetical protein